MAGPGPLCQDEVRSMVTVVLIGQVDSDVGGPAQEGPPMALGCFPFG